jgi:hypothetical protein
MVSGTIRYTEEDFTLSQTAFSQGRTLPLWQAACAMACLGAIIGYGLATLLFELLKQTLPALSQYKAWASVGGAILFVSAGAWRLSAKLSPMQQAALRLPQNFVVDESGLRLSTESATTCMNWAHFLVARIESDWMVLRTQDETVVLLRPAFVADQAAWNEVQRIVGAHVAISSGMPSSL